MLEEMTCQDVRDALTRGAELDGALKTHVDRCAACRELADSAVLSALLAAGAASGDDARARELSAALGGALDEERKGLRVIRSLSTAVRQGVAAVAAFGVVVGVGLSNRRADFAEYPGPRMAAVTATLAVVLAVALRRTLRPLHLRSVTGRADIALFIAAIALPILLSALPAAHSTHPASYGGLGAELVPRALACFGFGLGTGLPLAVLLALATRSAAPSLGAVAAMLASAGLLGNLALQLHCPLTHPGHLLLGHATVAVFALGVSPTVWRLLGRFGGPG